MNLYARKRWEVLIVCLSIIFVSTIFSQSYEVLTIQADGINIRQEANVNSKVVLKLNATDRCDVLSVGSKETVSGKEDYWYEVKYQSRTGWVFGAFTSLRLDGRKTVTAIFEYCDAGDMEHIIFKDTDGNQIDFGGAPNNLGSYKLCVIPENDWIPTGNPQFVGKKFQVTYSMIKCLLIGYEGNMDGEIVEWPCIVKLELLPTAEFLDMTQLSFNIPNYYKLNNGLMYLINRDGDGLPAGGGNLITVHFKVWKISDTSNLFSDWSIDNLRQHDLLSDSYLGQPLKFILGTNAFIRGSDEGIVGMKVGEKRTIIIPSQLAYGSEGLGSIPPNTNFKLFIELLDIKKIIPVKEWDTGDRTIQTTTSGLKYLIFDDGFGPNAKSGDNVTVNYSGYLTDGTKFDSSVERDTPFSFVLGNGSVIKGWEEGIMLIKKGGRIKLIIPPDLGYGQSNISTIPPNSTLIFDIELIDIVQK